MLTSTQEKIVRGVIGGFSMKTCSDIARRGGVAESTVRRHLQALITARYIRHTSYVGMYAAGDRADELAA